MHRTTTQTQKQTDIIREIRRLPIPFSTGGRRGETIKAAVLVIEKGRINELASDELLQSGTSSRNKATQEKGVKKRTAVKREAP